MGGADTHLRLTVTFGGWEDLESPTLGTKDQGTEQEMGRQAPSGSVGMHKLGQQHRNGSWCVWVALSETL